jgi:hypothetical protein
MGTSYVQQIGQSDIQQIRKCWIRRIRVTLTSKETTSNGKHYQIVLGDSGKDDLDISISGTKNLAILKDSGTVTVNNLGYDTIALIMAARLYLIKIEIGYKSSDSMITVFKGEVSYISHKPHARGDTTTYISYASSYVAAWSQGRINFTCRSGVNLYSMINYMFIQNGVSAKTNISPELKKIVLDKVYNSYDKASNIITDVVGSTGANFQMETDSSLDDNVISVTTIGEKRVIPIDLNTINIENGNPVLTSQGLTLSVIPSFNFIPGDIIKIDNSFIDISSGTSNASGVTSTFNQSYLDQNGCYMIRQVDYAFQNRGSQFDETITATAVSLFENLTGVSG